MGHKIKKYVLLALWLEPKMGTLCASVLSLLGSLQIYTTRGCHPCNRICSLKLTLLLSQRAWRLLFLRILFKRIKLHLCPKTFS